VPDHQGRGDLTGGPDPSAASAAYRRRADRRSREERERLEDMRLERERLQLGAAYRRELERLGEQIEQSERLAEVRPEAAERLAVLRGREASIHERAERFGVAELLD